jgi:hypothetical protein
MWQKLTHQQYIFINAEYSPVIKRNVQIIDKKHAQQKSSFADPSYTPLSSLIASCVVNEKSLLTSLHQSLAQNTQNMKIQGDTLSELSAIWCENKEPNNRQLH